MTRDEFFAWLNSCPTHHHEIQHDEEDYLLVNFRITKEENQDDTKRT